MIRSVTTSFIRLILFTMVLCLASGPACAEDPAPPAPQSGELQQRIDFGNAQILGQQIKSGVVYLMHRKKSDIKNMLEVRQHYREEIKDDFDLGGTAIVGRTAKAPMKTDR